MPVVGEVAGTTAKNKASNGMSTYQDVDKGKDDTRYCEDLGYSFYSVAEQGVLFLFIIIVVVVMYLGAWRE